MPWYRMPDGTPVHLNLGRGNRSAPPACRVLRLDGSVCGWLSGYQCDWKIGVGKTCDRWICEAHAQQVGPDKHLCPEHQRAYRAWQAARGKATEAQLER